MSRQIRSRRAGQPRDDRSLYARLLRLRHLRPNGVLSFLFFEGAIAVAVLLALAELLSWWGVLVLPACVALMVKVNDLIAGAAAHPAGVRRSSGRQRSSTQRAGRATGPGAERSADWQRSAVSERSALSRRSAAFRGPAASRGPAGDGAASAGSATAPAPRQEPAGPAGPADDGGFTPTAPAPRHGPAGSADDAGIAPTIDPWWSPEGGPEFTAGTGSRAEHGTPDNTHPVARQWGDRAEQVDAREQWARQSGSRRYE